MKAIYILMFMTLATVAQGQIEELGAITQIEGPIRGYKYVFKSPRNDTITIKIVDPWGKLISTPLQNKVLAAQESVPFEFKSNFWKRGNYQIIVESKSGDRHFNKLSVDATGNKIKYK
ncbi:MAG: hypothetical protein KDC53_19145 [Saprospiraceae bacterium]|nr:hypothetical protein [Saprospiraceae bacterium]